MTQNVVLEPFALSDNFTHIIHAVGPDCRRPNRDEARQELLSETYANLFTTIQEVGDVSSVVSPPIRWACLPTLTGKERLTLQVLLEMMDGEKDYGIVTPSL